MTLKITIPIAKMSIIFKIANKNNNCDYNY